MALLMILVPVAALVAVLLVGWLATEATRRAPAPSPHHEALRYLVPEGQDPAVLLAAFADTDYDAALRDDGGERVLVVSCPHGLGHDRSEVREMIAHVGTAIDDPAPVRFDDERGPRP